MAKLNLTFYGVEGTVGKKGESIASVIGNKTSTLEAEIEHLKTVNRKLMQRNLDLSKKESASKFLG